MSGWVASQLPTAMTVAGAPPAASASSRRLIRAASPWPWNVRATLGRSRGPDSTWAGRGPNVGEGVGAGSAFGVAGPAAAGTPVLLPTSHPAAASATAAAAAASASLRFTGHLHEPT